MTEWLDLAGLYCGPAPEPGGLWTRWNLDPWLLAALAMAAVPLSRSRAGLAALALLVVAFVSPLCALSSALFSARAVHHVLLVAGAAPLLAMAGATRWPRLGAAPSFLLSTAALWLWHLPAAYDLALSNIGVYWIMQLTLLGSATLFWQAVLTGEHPAGAALLWILAGFMQMGFLGAILTFAPGALYAAHAVAPLAWGFTPLEDQQLGGLIMWVPAGLPYLLLIGLVARRTWLSAGAQAA